jgi:hypothetical protein
MTETPVAPAGPVDAPWGLTARGTPYKRNPNRGPASPRKRSSPNKKSGPTMGERRAAAAQLIGIPAAALGIAGQLTGSVPLVADAIVLSGSADSIGAAVAEVAEQQPALARVVDRIVQAGPYAALFAALTPVALQLAAHHVPPLARIFGVQTADAVVRSAAEEAETAGDE